jgi:hypothetical protein
MMPMLSWAENNPALKRMAPVFDQMEKHPKGWGEVCS